MNEVRDKAEREERMKQGLLTPPPKPVKVIF
jgi:hypothetical protein